MHNFKYGVHVLTWASEMRNESLDYLSELKRIGYDGCEIPLIESELNLVDPKYIREKLQDLEMGCVTSTGINEKMSIVSEDKGIREKGINHLKKCIDITQEIGSNLLTGALYAPVGINPKAKRTAEQWKRSIDSLRVVADYADLKGISLALEPLNRYETYFINIADDAIKLIEEIGKRNVKLHLDVYHMNIEEKNIYKVIKNANNLVGHIHCAENDRGTPGTGHTDWDGLIKGLIEINYNGWLVVETFFSVIDSISAVTPIWRQLAPSPSIFITEGFKFLKNKVDQINKSLC